MSELTNERLQEDYALFMAGQIIKGQRPVEAESTAELTIIHDSGSKIDYSRVNALDFAYVSLGHVRDAYAQGAKDQAAQDKARAISRDLVQSVDKWDVEQDQLQSDQAIHQPTDNVA